MLLNITIIESARSTQRFLIIDRIKMVKEVKIDDAKKPTAKIPTSIDTKVVKIWFVFKTCRKVGKTNQLTTDVSAA